MPVKVAVRCIENNTVFESLTEAAAYAGVSVQLISNSCSSGTSAKGLHYERVDGCGRLSVSDRLRRNRNMRKDHERGLSIVAIARKYGISYGAACDVCKGSCTDENIKRKDDERKRRDRNILRDHKDGMTYDSLAKKYGLSRSGIYLCLRRADEH